MTRILIVDNEEPIRALVRECLAAPGVEVLEAADAEAGWACIAAGAPDVVLLDMIMPGASGLELLARIRNDERLRELPVIFLSARASREDLANGLRAGANGYVTKPFSPRRLQDLVRPFLRHDATQP